MKDVRSGWAEHNIKATKPMRTPAQIMEPITRTNQLYGYVEEKKSCELVLEYCKRDFIFDIIYIYTYRFLYRLELAGWRKF